MFLHTEVAVAFVNDFIECLHKLYDFGRVNVFMPRRENSLHYVYIGST